MCVCVCGGGGGGVLVDDLVKAAIFYRRKAVHNVELMGHVFSCIRYCREYFLKLPPLSEKSSTPPFTFLFAFFTNKLSDQIRSCTLWLTTAKNIMNEGRALFSPSRATLKLLRCC